MRDPFVLDTQLYGYRILSPELGSQKKEHGMSLPGPPKYVK